MTLNTTSLLIAVREGRSQYGGSSIRTITRENQTTIRSVVYYLDQGEEIDRS